MTSYLIAGEKQQRIVIFCERINGGKDALKIDIVVRRPWIVSVERVVRCVHVQSEIDARVRQSVHARIVILRVVHSIDTNGIDPQLRELLDVSLASLRIRYRVFRLRRPAWLIVNAPDIESVFTCEECFFTTSATIRLMSIKTELPYHCPSQRRPESCSISNLMLLLRSALALQQRSSRPPKQMRSRLRPSL